MGLVQSSLQAEGGASPHAGSGQVAVAGASVKLVLEDGVLSRVSFSCFQAGALRDVKGQDPGREGTVHGCIRTSSLQPAGGLVFLSLCPLFPERKGGKSVFHNF